ncbi:MAG: alpha/beta hydrolase, partial [Bacteroidota bacterium]
KYLILIILGAIVIFFLLIWRVALVGMYLPQGAEQVIDEVWEEDLPEFVTGETGYADSDEVRIWYEIVGKPKSTKGTILLIRGLTRTALHWHPSFYEPMIEAGYQVIRFDNRDVGMSDWIEDWSEENAYTVHDMAKDAIAVLNAIGVDRVHLVGISLGGAIAQEVVIHYPERVLTLTTIASSGESRHDLPDIPDIAKNYTRKLGKIILRYAFLGGEKNEVRLALASDYATKGEAEYTYDTKNTVQRILYELRERNGSNSKALNQQLYAGDNSEPRFEHLAKLEIPVLIVHGTKDFLLDIEHSKKLASVIPNAQTLWVEGMGHDIPPEYVDQIIERLLSMLDKNTHDKLSSPR